MDNDKRSSEFNEINPSEYNVLTQEDNCIQNITNSEHFNSSNVTKDEISKPKVNNSTNIHKSSNIFRLVSSFIAVCVVAAVVQTAFPIPIFSTILNPGTETNVIPVTPITPIIPDATYTIEGVTSTYNSISYSITIDNVDDFVINEYSVILVQDGNDNDEFISTISEKILSTYKTIITTKTYNGMFTTYASNVGIKKLEQDTNYVILLLKDEKIVQKQSISTVSMVYLSEINVYFTPGVLNITLKTDSSFTGYGTVLIQAKNLTIPTWGPEKNGIDCTTCSEADLATSKFAFNVTKWYLPQVFEVKIYCITTDPEKKALPDTVTHGDELNPEYYYLIYTYDKLIIYY